jgi:Zn2+/Cd2+-exporting ATPase
MFMTRRENHKAYVVAGVCCATEEGVLRKSLDGALGQNRYTFSLINAELRVDAAVPEDDVLRGIRHAGFRGRPKTAIVPDEPFFQRHGHALRTLAGALLTIAGSAAAYFPVTGPAGKILLCAAIVVSGWEVFPKALIALRNRALDMNVLMSLAVIGALAIDRWSEGAAVIVLFSVALMLETYSTSRARRAVQSLIALSPAQACVVREGGETITPAASVQPGDVVVIRPGERIPVDGLVIGGSSSVDQSTITGESVPVERSTGDTVYAGSLNERGALRVRATHRYEETTLAQIIHLIEAAEHQRAPIQSFIDRFAAVYTPAVLGLAVLVALLPPLVAGASFVDWLYRALVLLVIACPCALVISTPVTLVSALANGARNGVLIKGGRHLEAMASIRAIAFDKTGTLTEGRLTVTDVVSLDSLAGGEILQIVAAMEHHSEHHLAAALLHEMHHRDLAYLHLGVDEFDAIPGRGIAATVDGTRYFVGNRELGQERQFWSPAAQEAASRFVREGKTTMVLGVEGRALGIIALRDSLRAECRSSVADLRSQGISHLVMLSGDHEDAAARMAGEAGVREWFAHLLPQEKVAAIRRLKGIHRSVAMVGDGINDAPALAAASVGIAMGAAGTDTTLETADIVLMGDNLKKLPYLVALGRYAMRIIRQNIALALALKIIFLVLSIAGISTLWMAILADDGAALAVILNGLRVLTFRRSSN